MSLILSQTVLLIYVNLGDVNVSLSLLSQSLAVTG